MLSNIRREILFKVAIVIIIVLVLSIFIARTFMDNYRDPGKIKDNNSGTLVETAGISYLNWTWNDPEDSNFSRVMVYLDGKFKGNVSKGKQYYNATNLKAGTEHTIALKTVDKNGNINLTWINHTAMTMTDLIQPASITGLTNVTFDQNFINWTWADPEDPDFKWVKIYLDGKFMGNVSKGKQYYNATKLKAGTEHTIATRTEDTNDNINPNWINHTAMTMTDLIQPASITGLANVTFDQNFINWTWADPEDPDFKWVKIYLDGKFMGNVSKGKQYYNATKLKAGTEHTIATRTEDTNDNINPNWINHTAITMTDLIQPASITGLTNATFDQNFINWTWADPEDPDFKWVKIYLDGKFIGNVSKGKQYYNATKLKAGTEHTIATRTEDMNDNINPNWINHTAMTII